MKSVTVQNCPRNSFQSTFYPKISSSLIHKDGNSKFLRGTQLYKYFFLSLVLLKSRLVFVMRILNTFFFGGSRNEKLVIKYGFLFFLLFFSFMFQHLPRSFGGQSFSFGMSNCPIHPKHRNRSLRDIMQYVVSFDQPLQTKQARSGDNAS